MGAQGGALVRRAEQPAPLQQRHDLRDEHVEHLRQHRWHQVEAVGNAVLHPILHEIGHLLRRALESEMPPRAGELGQQLPQCRLLLTHETNDHLGAAARSLDRLRVGKIGRRQFLIQRQMRKIVPPESQG